MNRPVLRRIALALTVSGLVAGASTASASAAAIAVPSRCVNYAPNLAGRFYVPVFGAGFTPSTTQSANVRLNWGAGSDLAGYASARPDGTFVTGAFHPAFLPPEGIISNRRPLQSYTLHGYDLDNPANTASTRVRFVRIGLNIAPRGEALRRKIRFYVYGVRRGARMWAQYMYHGKIRYRTYLGRTTRTCGTLRTARKTFLPVRAHLGTWRIYLTATSRYHRSTRQPPYWLFNVYRRYRFGSLSADGPHLVSTAAPAPGDR